MGHLKKLQEFAETKHDPRVRKLAVVSLMAVFKDVLPGYVWESDFRHTARSHPTA